MCSEPENQHNSMPIVHRNDKAKLVPFDVEHNPLSANDAGRSKELLQFGGTLPFRTSTHRIPGVQMLFDDPLPLALDAITNKAVQRAPRNDSHLVSLHCSRFGSNW